MTRSGLPQTASLASAIVVLSALILAVGHTLGAQAPAIRHLALERSVPEAGASVGTEIEEVRPFFTQPPQPAGTSIRIVDLGDQMMVATQARPDADDPSEIFVTLEGELPAGSYTVHWRALAQDSHPANGDFEFQVVAQ